MKDWLTAIGGVLLLNLMCFALGWATYGWLTPFSSKLIPLYIVDVAAVLVVRLQLREYDPLRSRRS